jgi:protein-disulfide isomerase
MKKNLGDEPSLIKPAIIVIAVFLIIGGVYALFGEKKFFFKKDKNSVESNETLVNSSGIDKEKMVRKVEDVEQVVAKWIEANPKAIINSVANMQKQEMENRAKDAQKNIITKKDELFNDKNSPQYAPPNYDVTIVEFFDYSCGYCKKAQITVEELLKEDRKVRIIYKEFPILGPASTEMTTVALAVYLAEPASYKKFHGALMKSNTKGKEAALKIAESVGIDAVKIETTLKNDADKISAIIQSNLMLGGNIGINGTPGFIIGEELIPGAFELQAFKEKIAVIRKNK